MTETPGPLVQITEGTRDVYVQLGNLFRLLALLPSNGSDELQVITVARAGLLNALDNVCDVRGILGFEPVPDGVALLERPKLTEPEYQAIRGKEIVDELDARDSAERTILYAFMSFEADARCIEAELVELFDEAGLTSETAQAATMRLRCMGWLELRRLRTKEDLQDDGIFSVRLAAIPAPAGKWYTSARLTNRGRSVLDNLLASESDEESDDESAKESADGQAESNLN